MAEEKRVYTSVHPRISDLQAESYGPELDRLRGTYKGDVSPQEVVDAARSKKNPLHDYFEWDDTKCGVMYRRNQAGRLMRAIEVRIVDDGQTSRQFIALPTEPGESIRGTSTEYRYHGGQEVLDDPQKRARAALILLGRLKPYIKQLREFGFLAAAKELEKAYEKAKADTGQEE